jgi:aspartyl-tRNA(Asn)/glutamyl-tRNA(Gln) amidotransferase subunit C
MVNLSKSDVIHVAKLAKLSLTPSEVAKFQKQLSSVLDYISELNKVDTNGVTPTSQTTGLSGVTRKDEVESGRVLIVDQALSGTDKTHNGYFMVRRVINKGN